jgi:hypothetical protein
MNCRAAISCRAEALVMAKVDRRRFYKLPKMGALQITQEPKLDTIPRLDGVT